jgi:cysteine desulfurase
MIYLDWAATSPYNRSAIDISLAESLECFANPSSQHCEGKKARKVLDSAREGFLLSLFRSQPSISPYGSVHFTASGTEADQIPITALARKFLEPSRLKLDDFHKTDRPHILTTGIEHPAVYNQCALLSKLGFDVEFIFPDEDGLIDPMKVSERLRDRTEFVSIMAVNNETGSIQRIQEIASVIFKANSKISRRRQQAIWFHVDAVQALGKIPIDFFVPGVSSAAFSAHKIGGPKGVGALWCSRSIEPFHVGGGQENNVRSGTENIFGIGAFSRASTYATETLAASATHSTKLEARLLEGILRMDGAGILPHSRRLRDFRWSPYILNACFKGVSGEVLARALSDQGVCVSTGSACSSKIKAKTSRVLTAMGIPSAEAQSSIRISHGLSTTESEIDTFLYILRDLYQRLKT